MAPTIRGRHTARASTPKGRAPRHMEPWVLEAKENTTLEGLQNAYLDTLAAVDDFDAHRAKAIQSNTLTPTGITADSLNYAASKLAPRLQKAKREVERAREEWRQRAKV
jgi:hypothetical protein